jgi:hypothetical protein
VHLQAARLREALPAHAAAERPLARVHAHVALDVAGLGEVFPAHAAAERLLRGRRVEPLGVELLQVEEGLAEVPRVGQRRGHWPAGELTPGARRGVPMSPPVRLGGLRVPRRGDGGGGGGPEGEGGCQALLRTSLPEARSAQRLRYVGGGEQVMERVQGGAVLLRGRRHAGCVLIGARRGRRPLRA